MESATIAANGFRFRVPYGTLLCVSDKPLHGELKLAGMASDFYRQQVSQHLEIGLTRWRSSGSSNWNACIRASCGALPKSRFSEVRPAPIGEKTCRETGTLATTKRLGAKATERLHATLTSSA